MDSNPTTPPNRCEEILNQTAGKPLPRPGTDDFDTYAAQAEEALRSFLNDGDLTFDEVLAVNAAWTWYAGHKRLGRIFSKIAQERGFTRRK